MKGLTAENLQSPRGDDAAALISVVQNVRDVLRLDAADHAMSKMPRSRGLKRVGSLVNQGPLSRKPSASLIEPDPSGRSTPTMHSTAATAHLSNNRKPPPQVAMIREVIMPPSLPGDLIQLLESALKFQNMGQHNVRWLCSIIACVEHLN